MELLIAILGLMDDTLLAVLALPVLGPLLVGYLVLALVGMFLQLQRAVGGRNQKK